MPIESQWYDEEKTILLHKLSGILNLEDFRKAFQESTKYPTNYVIVEVDKETHLPVGLLTVVQTLTAAVVTQTRVVVTVGADKRFQVFAKSFFKMAGYAVIEFVNTPEEAEALIAKQRATLES